MNSPKTTGSQLDLFNQGPATQDPFAALAPAARPVALPPPPPPPQPLFKAPPAPPADHASLSSP